jgi:hypothetical protein
MIGLVTLQRVEFVVFDIQPFAGLLFIIIILPRISSGAIDIKSLQDLKKIFVY